MTKLRTGQITDSSEAWTVWTPTLTNLTIGNGSIIGGYQRLGTLIVFRLRIIFGNTTSMGTGPTFTLPVPASTIYPVSHVISADVTLLDSGTSRFRGAVDLNSPTVGNITALVATGTFLTSSGGGVTSTVPMAWTTSDEIQIHGYYEAA